MNASVCYIKQEGGDAILQVVISGVCVVLLCFLFIRRVLKTTNQIKNIDLPEGLEQSRRNFYDLPPRSSRSRKLGLQKQWVAKACCLANINGWQINRRTQLCDGSAVEVEISFTKQRNGLQVGWTRLLTQFSLARADFANQLCLHFLCHQTFKDSNCRKQGSKSYILMNIIQPIHCFWSSNFQCYFLQLAHQTRLWFRWWCCGWFWFPSKPTD